VDTYFLGQGKLLASIRSLAGVPQGFTEIGDVSSLDLRLGMALMKYALSGAEVAPPAIKQGEHPSFSMVIDNFSSENIARVLYGAQTEIVGGAIASETVVAFSAKSVPLAHINLLSFTSLTNADASVTYILGTDYTVDLDAGMLTFPVGSAIANAQSLRANYVIESYTKLSAGVFAPPFLWLRFNGLNTAEDVKPVIIDIYKVRYDPIEAFSLIQESDIARLIVNGRIFYDGVQPDTTTDGRWLRIRKV
jgi:hypothetical protein